MLAGADCDLLIPRNRFLVGRGEHQVDKPPLETLPSSDRTAARLFWARKIRVQAGFLNEQPMVSNTRQGVYAGAKQREIRDLARRKPLGKILVHNPRVRWYRCKRAVTQEGSRTKLSVRKLTPHWSCRLLLKTFVGIRTENLGRASQKIVT
ncbi:MAG TPA: hypothetical protein VGX71_09310 [Pseudaminobacter sp.]|nr:hypothetical protein [Pseudaminobacter sp.]